MDFANNTNYEYNININNYNLEFFKSLVKNNFYFLNTDIDKQILYNNNIDSSNNENILYYNSLKINILKEEKLLAKIIDLSKKYKYYKYKLLNSDKKIYDIFINSQKIYFFYFNIINKKIKNRSIIHNQEDLICNNIQYEDKIFNIYIDRFIYKFTYYDFIKLINNSLLNYEEPITLNNLDNDIDNILIKPVQIKNPYTNLPFKQNVLYNFYLFSINNKFRLSTLFILYYESNFNIKKLISNNEFYMIKKTFNIYIKNLSTAKKHIFLIQTINMFINFIIKYIKPFSIRYLAHNYKLKFYNLQENEIEYYNSFLKDYLIAIYYYNNKIYKNYINHKIKIVMNLIYDTNIKFIDPNLQTFLNSDITSDKIMSILLNNIRNIINSEFDNIALSENVTYNSNNINNQTRDNTGDNSDNIGENSDNIGENSDNTVDNIEENSDNTGENSDNIEENNGENSDLNITHIPLIRRVFYFQNINNNDISLINITNDFSNTNLETITILENKQKNIKNYKNKFYILREAIKTNFYPFLININKTLFLFTKANIYILTNIYVSHFIYKNFKN